ncbi:MAG TPA: hypothetical protein VF383_03495 [Candidatus Dormibacteraeota bacterium]
MARGAVTATSVADSIVSSRLLIVQSKRLMLSSLERRFRLKGGDSMRKRADRIRDETAEAHATYRSAVLTYGQASSREFRLVAYSSLANLGDNLVLQMRDTISHHTPGEQFTMAAEVEMLEDVIEQWRKKGRPQPSSVMS